MKNLTVTQKAIAEACGNDLELIQFFNEWVANGKNATKAYLKLHPDTTEGSAATMGSRLLSRVDKVVLLQAYGLGVDKYMRQLNDGIEADKWNDFTGEREPDHRTRREYHKALGKIMGIEDERAQIQINNFIPLLGGESKDALPKDDSNKQIIEVNQEN